MPLLCDIHVLFLLTVLCDVFALHSCFCYPFQVFLKQKKEQIFLKLKCRKDSAECVEPEGCFPSWQLLRDSHPSLVPPVRLYSVNPISLLLFSVPKCAPEREPQPDFNTLCTLLTQWMWFTSSCCWRACRG